ncbi:inactive rhomboid protein 1 isoform X1 [Tribolium madens]|uniref:inactive rhomboid protein 1 isoform X1 n=1 Tax=Tribolium madens TaxID=41895 RepID=UPI001CF71D42|nr:inactive rhomboid protein 1 isoform X1 [Tribolium madens]
MPVEEDYGRRQITLQQHASQSPVPPSLQCPVGCISAPADHRYASDKNLLDPAERYSDRFGSERSNSDRLPSGERYQGVSERYPLGERPQTSVSSERLQPAEERTQFQTERYHYATCQRYPERYTPVGSLDRYHTHTVDRYSRTSTPTDRYHTLSDKDKTNASDRYTPIEKYQGENFSANDRHNSAQSVCSIERYTPTERHRSKSSDMYKIRERSASSDRKTERYQQYQNRYDQYVPERFPAIPCPERFATQERNERVPFTQVPYMEPPSPAPASDRFVPPPPLSPENTPSPDCFPNNAFPSPTNTVPPAPERFIPPPPLSPSPTEKYSPKKVERYEKQRYPDRYDRYHRNQYYPPNERYHVNPDRFVTNDRYIPPNAHMPVERYVPQQQEPYYNTYQSYERYPKFNANDPYMRRDLAFHYRLPLPYSSNQYQRIRYSHMGTPNRVKCCQYQDGYQLSKSSPGSSSSSSVTSQGKDLHQKEVPCVNNSSLQEMQCQSYQTCAYQQEKGTQCGKECVGFVSPNLRAKGQCRHSICASPSVEYVGASGGRHVCATPPPRGSIGSADGSVCNDNCCTTRRSQNSLTVAVWRAAAPSQPPAPQQQPSPPQQRTTTPVTDDASSSDPKPSETPELRQPQHSPASSKIPPVQRAVSLPATSPPERPRIQPRLGYTQSERLPNRPSLARSLSRKEMIKNYIKKETATFFGVDEESEEKQQRRWLDRRIRMASRTYGPLKDEYRTLGSTYRRTISEMAPGGRMSGQLQAERPDVLPGPNDVVDTNQERLHEVTVRRKDSVARMTWDGLSYVVNTLTRHRPRRRSQQSQQSRSFPPDTPYSSSSVEEETFFQKPTSPTSPRPQEEGDTIDRGHEATLQPAYRDRLTIRPGSGGWRREPHVVLRHEGQNRPTVGGSRVFSSLLDNVLDNSNRRQYGMGWVGRMFGRSIRHSVTQDDKILQQLDDMEDHRPMFTYWVTTVQILVLFISLVCYGLGPFGIDLHSRSGQVLVTSLSLQQVDYMEPANFWFGPRASDLIHLGAKFAPCMRIDDKISQQIDKIRAKERETACCIRNDDSGCVQSSQADCSLRGLRPTKTISKWKKWSAGEAGPGGRISGSVCGLDPKFCDAPASVHPYEWPDDITKWPICRKTNTQFSIQKRSGSRDKSAEHMVCEVIGHPCCIGIHGQCKITTKEYCDFVQGTFHEEASLCSQVSCLNDVCGMLPFYFAETPDQFYRLWTSLFLHAGVLQLAVTVLIQYFLMRDLEKLTGSLRIGIIYIGSGVAGNLASAIFVPYRADVGPAGSQFGLLACLIVEVLNSWPMLKHPNQALCKLLSITLVLFLIGLLPWVDNYAHLFGFVFGFLLSYALLPFISFGVYERRKKIVLIWVCLVSAGVLFICLVLLFYIIPVYDCKICSYFNCIPFTRDFCASQNINFKREEPIV